jgi:hypothetical protein
LISFTIVSFPRVPRQTLPDQSRTSYNSVGETRSIPGAAMPPMLVDALVTLVLSLIPILTEI